MPKKVKVTVNGVTVECTEEQARAIVAAAPVSGSPAEAPKPKRSLAFKTYESGSAVPSTAQAFSRALAHPKGDGAAALYAHASTATRGTSAAALREIASDPAVAAALRVFLASLS